MERGGWRRPSAPSIFHHFESLGRRLSGTPPSLSVIPSASLPARSAPPALRHGSALAPIAAPACTAVAARRPSAIVLLSRQAPTPEEERGLMESPDLDRDGSTNSFTPLHQRDEYMRVMPKFDDTITVYLSAMYAKLLITLGLAFPVMENIKSDRKYYQGFYLYLYIGTFCFLSFMYGNMLRKRALLLIVNTYRRKGSQPRPSMTSLDARGGGHGPRKHYGSFYLRLGAIAFGIGSMVYSGLEFGQFFELRPDCRTVTQALTPLARMVLTLVQMQFIFLNNREMDILRHKVVAQFGLMHMIATNLCEWLTVIIEETKHEIDHMDMDGIDGNETRGGGHGGASHHIAERSSHGGGHGAHHAVANPCFTSEILATLVRNAAPFLFPCTIEYSLICAVVLFEMWKNAHRQHANGGEDGGNDGGHGREHHGPPGLLGVGARSANHLSVDCTKAHKGLFAGIILVVMTIISLILYFVLTEEPGFDEMGLLVVNVCELIMYVVTSLAVLGAFYRMRSLKYLNKAGGLGLDNTLLVMAQVGVFMYNLFAVLAYCAGGQMPRILVSELIGLIQTIMQTIFVLDSTRRRCCTPREHRRKPGRQMVTFLLVANMAMWIVNTMEKSRARSRPRLIQFYGPWPWTLIVHISMPLAIFYRFHSTICLFEIWKGCYKLNAHSSRGDSDSRKHTDSERSERS
ncbi:hypothetical protein ONE63_001867 [Megalurothrips usitatus]|uniref:Proton channel OtopLc-like n=1 Tax=Megalurothrips usitatus TaxID=439358 RepID=A0AAV7XE34_9NEOP|nr:hypothetical protein ONE63_001867 [Megalurothrips usitatus]